MSDERPDGWPPEVRQIGLHDLRRLGIGADNQLHWDGRRVEIQRRLVLTRLQTRFALVATLFAILGGLGGFVSGVNNAAIFLCARDTHWLGCPPALPAPPPTLPRG